MTRDPIGYVDGLSLYRAYFAEIGALDPFGTGLTTEWVQGSFEGDFKLDLEKFGVAEPLATFFEQTTADIEYTQRFHWRCEGGEPLFGLIGGTEVNAESWISFLKEVDLPAEYDISLLTAGWSVVATNNDGVVKDCEKGESGRKKTVEVIFTVFFKAGLGISHKGVGAGEEEDLIDLGSDKKTFPINCCC